MAPLFFDRKALACVFALKFLNDNSNDEQFQLPPQAEAGEDGPIRLTGGCPSDIEEEEEGEYGGGNVARMPSAEELRRRQEEEHRIEANERAAREYQAHYDAADEERGADRVNLSNRSFSSSYIDEVYAASAAGVTVAAAHNNPAIQPPPQDYDALSSSDDDTVDAPVTASSAAAASASGTKERSNTNISMSSLLQQAGEKVSSVACLLNCKRNSPDTKHHDTMFIRSETNAKNVTAKKTRQEPADPDTSEAISSRSISKTHKQQRLLGCLSNSAVVDTTPFVPQGQANDKYALLCVGHREWAIVTSQSSTKQSPKDHREGTLPNAFNGDDLADVLIHILMNFPSNSPKTKEKILSGGIAYTNDEGIPDQVSWRSIIVPLIKIMEKYYGATRAEAIEKVRKHVAYGNRIPIMAHPGWNKCMELKKDYKKCTAVTDAAMRRLYKDSIKSFPNLKATPVFGQPAFDEFVNNGALQEPLFEDYLIQESSLPHGSQLHNGYGITKEQRDNTLVVLNKIAAILMEVEATPLPEDELDEILPYFTKNLGGGIKQNSRGKYISLLTDEMNGLSLEQIEDMDNIDDSFLDGRSRWAIQKSVKKVIEQGQEATIHTYICTGCARSRPCQYNHYHSRCKDSEGKQGYFRLLRLPNGSTIDPIYRGYCFNTGCKFTGRFGAIHKCPIEAGKKIRLKSLTPPPGFTPKKKNDVLIQKIASQSGEILGGFCGAQGEASRDFVDEASRQGITTLPKSTLNREVKKIKLSSIMAQFGKVIVGKDNLQNGSVVLGNVIYEGVPICLPTTDAVDNDDDDNDDDDPKKSDDNNDDNSDDGMKPAAVPKPSGSKMKLDFGAKKLSTPPKDSKSKSRGTKELTVGKKSSSDATGRIDGCSCGPYSKCSTIQCTCRQVDEACDPKRCKCNCGICENTGRKSSGDKGDDEGKKRQMKLSFFKKSG